MSDRDALTIAETIDGYRAQCADNPLNTLARSNQHYRLSEINQHQTYFLREAVKSIPIVQPCEFVILDSTADSGLPHTRPPNYICLPDSMCKAQPATKSFQTTLLHEAIHVHQRLFPEEWATAYRRVGWRPIDRDQIPANFLERCRINPDTISNPFWAFDDYHIPLPLFRRVDQPALADAPVQWLDIRMNSLFHTPPTHFQDVYRNQHLVRPEHPNEIYAEIFSENSVNTYNKVFEYLKQI